MEWMTAFRVVCGTLIAAAGFYCYISAFRTGRGNDGVREARVWIGMLGMLSGTFTAMQPFMP